MHQSAVADRLGQIHVSLRTGSWLTGERLRVYPAIVLLLFVAAILGLLATSHAGKDLTGRPLGVDFSGQWVAGVEVLAGAPSAPYDNRLHAAGQAAVFGPSDTYLPWNYPPIALGLAAAFALAPYLVALAGWMAATLSFYVAAVRRALGPSDLPATSVLLAALGFPALAINVLHGQNGCFTAGLMTFGALWLPGRPILAGCTLALLAYKPQFLIALPVVLLAGGYARAAVAFGVTLLLLVLASVLAFGVAPWHAFAESLAFSRSEILESGGLESYKLQSAFAAVRLVGGSVALAYGVQACVSIVVLCGLAWTWRGSAAGTEQPRALRPCKVAALLVASLLVTPYAVDYDMVLLGPALAALVNSGRESGFPPYGKSLLASVWTMPLLARLAGLVLHMPLGLAVMLVLYAAILRRAAVARRPQHSGPAPAVNPSNDIRADL